MEFPNYSSSFSSDNFPSWQQSFSAPSVVPGDYSSAFSSSGPTFNPQAYNSSFTVPGVSYAPASTYASQPASSNWLDYLKVGGLALSAAGDAVRAFRGEPAPPGGSMFQNYLAQEEQKESDTRLAQLLKDAMGSSSTEAITGVLDPAAERRERKTVFGQLPSLAGIGSSNGTRMAGSFLS